MLRPRNLLPPWLIIATLLIALVGPLPPASQVEAQAAWPCEATLFISTRVGAAPNFTADLFSINQQTAAFNPLGNSATDDYNALAFNPVDNFMYAVEERTGDYYRVATNNNITLVASIGAPFTAATFWWAGTFWLHDGVQIPGLAAGWYHLVAEGGNSATHIMAFIDPTNPLPPANPTTLTPGAGFSPSINITPGNLAWGDIAVHPTTNVIYASPQDLPRELYTIDPATGVATAVGQLRDAAGNAYYAAALFFDVYGQLWGYADSEPPAGFNFVDLVIINTTTAQVTRVNSGGSTNRSDGTSCPYTIHVQKNVTPASVVQGGTVTYTYTLTSNSDTSAPNVTFTDTMPGLPDERTYINGTATTTSGAITPGYGGTKTLEITGITIPAAISGAGGVRTPGTVTITVGVDIAFTPPGTVFNQASLNGLPAAINLPGNNTISDYPITPSFPDQTPLTVTPGGPDLAITKDDGTAVYTPGGTITYQIVVTNVGNVNALAGDPTAVQDTIPAEILNPSWTCISTGGATCTPGPVNGNISDTVDVPVGGTLTYTVTGTVAEGAQGTLSNTVTVSNPRDTNPANNTAVDQNEPEANASALVAPAAAAVAAASTGSGAAQGQSITIVDPAIVKFGSPESALPGEQVVWTITVTNNGNTPLSNVAVADPINSRFFTEIVDATTQKGTVTVNNLNVTYNIGDLQPGESVIMTLITLLSRSVTPADVIINTATMTADELPQPRSASATVAILSLPATGYPPAESATLPAAAILLGVFVGGMAGLSLLVLRRR